MCARFNPGRRWAVSACGNAAPDFRVRSTHAPNPGYRFVTRYRIVGITNSAPSLTPEGQRAVTVFVLV